MKQAFTLLLSLLLCSVSMAQDIRSDLASSIKIEDAEAHISFLASDAMMGRKAGTVYSRIAAEYIVSQLKQYGVKPFDGKYLHPFSAVNNERGKGGRWEVNADSIARYSLRCHRRMDMNNVLGVIEGKRSDEYVIIGAHFDHLGYDDFLEGDRIYNGADDNASGVAALLMIARSFVQSEEKPERSIIFAFWDGEEEGLLGSCAFAETFDMSQVKGYINFDMIGRTTYGKERSHVVFFYTAPYKAFESWTREAISRYGLGLQPDYRAWDNPVSGSDNATFAVKGIPVIWYHTDAHDDYHQPSDHADKIDFAKVRDIAISAYVDLFYMANTDF